MRKSFYSIFLMASLFAIIACESTQDPIVTNNLNMEKLLNETLVTCQNSSATTVDVEKVIEKVQTIINNNQKISLNSNDYSLRTINDDNGDVALYIANFHSDKGFVVVSASKNYEPILAFSEKGSFPSDENTPAALEAWIKETIIDIKKSRFFPLDSASKFHYRWKTMISPSEKPLTLSPNNNQNRDHISIWNNQVMAWINAGYTLHNITDSYITGNSQIDNLMREYAQDGVFPDYDWRTYSIVVEYYPGNYRSYNLIQSDWQQNNHYNDSCPLINGQNALVGCGPVAMGQVMRYHQFPTDKNWSNMPYHYSTPTTAQFLREIGDYCYVLYDTTQSTTSLSFVNDALNYYGYYTDMGYHNKTKVINSLDCNRPVIMRGTITTSNGNSEHQWVASGYYGGSFCTRYELFVMETPTIISSGYQYDINPCFIEDHFYMNWGWGPNTGNGFYYDNGNETVPGSHPVYPIYNRADIYDIHPL